ncbi:hypothetical protein HYDPIDRAFT_120362 [Hydnomerulius pinastri MD-312]|uniref:Uncharacterized protein n=1 Tax=Hydnomerulius pinastri MD-312 TaxID=994086 RepID=A0A0C9UXL5_9AGAM|nr:hypothetical protein HYDPIDRAFT_120362 [Hydnomerulius pinastri MD-312]
MKIDGSTGERYQGLSKHSERLNLIARHQIAVNVSILGNSSSPHAAGVYIEEVAFDRKPGS